MDGWRAMLKDFEKVREPFTRCYRHPACTTPARTTPARTTPACATPGHVKQQLIIFIIPLITATLRIPEVLVEFFKFFQPVLFD